MAIEAAGYRPGEDIYIAMDAATSEFYNGDRFVHLQEIIRQTDEL